MHSRWFLRRKSANTPGERMYNVWPLLRAIYCDVRPESWNLPICWAGLHGACSRGNTKCTVTLGFDGTVEDTSMVSTSKQIVTTDMKNRNLQGGDSYPSRLAGIKGGRLRCRQKWKEGEEEVSRQWISELSRTKQSYAELSRIREDQRCERFGIQKELNVWTVIIECNCDSDVK
jgi:hypothetical protein